MAGALVGFGIGGFTGEGEGSDSSSGSSSSSSSPSRSSSSPFPASLSGFGSFVMSSFGSFASIPTLLEVPTPKSLNSFRSFVCTLLEDPFIAVYLASAARRLHIIPSVAIENLMLFTF